VKSGAYVYPIKVGDTALKLQDRKNDR
jgi:hypothetical protein